MYMAASSKARSLLWIILSLSLANTALADVPAWAEAQLAAWSRRL